MSFFGWYNFKYILEIVWCRKSIDVVSGTSPKGFWRDWMKLKEGGSVDEDEDEAGWIRPLLWYTCDAWSYRAKRNKQAVVPFIERRRQPATFSGLYVDKCTSSCILNGGCGYVVVFLAGAFWVNKHMSSRRENIRDWIYTVVFITLL